MKKLFYLIIILSTFAFKASAQQADAKQLFKAAKPFNAEEYAKHLGKIGVLYDTVKSLKIVSDTLTLLNMGGVYPHQKYTIAVRGNKISLDWANIKGKAVCVSGVFEMYKNQPQIMVAEPEFILVR